MSSKSLILDALKSCALEGHNMPTIDVAPDWMT